MSLENKIIELTKKEYEFVKDQKIVNLLKIILVDNEIDINKIENYVPITRKTIEKYMEEKTCILEYITEEEFLIFKNKIDNILKKVYEKQKKIVNLLKIVLIDNETDINKIEKYVPITRKTIEKYMEEKTCILEYATEQEFQLLKNRIDNIFKIESEKEEREKLAIVTKIIDEIFSTRHKLEKVCSNNFFSLERFKIILNQTTYIEDKFSVQLKQELKDKIAQTAKQRAHIPKDMILIEDRFHVFIANPNVVYLNRVDYKTLEYVSDYLCSGCNMEYVSNKFGTYYDVVIRNLSDPNIEKIIKPEHYENLLRYIKLEKFMLEAPPSDKKTFFEKFINILYENNFDKEIVLKYYQITECLLNRFFEEIIKNPYFDEDIKKDIKLFLNLEEEKKVK